MEFQEVLGFAHRYVYCLFVSLFIDFVYMFVVLGILFRPSSYAANMGSSFGLASGEAKECDDGMAGKSLQEGSMIPMTR